MAYVPLIIARSAAALDIESAIFFTFYGLDILNKKKNKNLKVPPLANPAKANRTPAAVAAGISLNPLTARKKEWVKLGVIVIYIQIFTFFQKSYHQIC
ncbi:MAG: hypothetical protein DRG71_09995 [Deltaproteobacteria bacterium]|nr:MAG: hypothetical protein DRG71_09995 [Deltaproteobacteria bacterium]